MLTTKYFKSFPLFQRSMANTLTQKYEEYKMKRQLDQFKTHIRDLAAKEKFTLRDYRKDILEQIKGNSSGLQKLLSGSSPQSEKLIQQRKMINAMNDEELDNIDLLKIHQKKDIAAVTQTSVEEVNFLIKSYENQVKMHQILRRRRDNGQQLPETPEELKSIVMLEGNFKSQRDRKQRDKKFSRKQREWASKEIRGE